MKSRSIASLSTVHNGCLAPPSSPHFRAGRRGTRRRHMFLTTVVQPLPDIIVRLPYSTVHNRVYVQAKGVSGLGET